MGKLLPSMFSGAEKVLERWSHKAMAQRLSKRRLQEEADTHKLLLLTRFQRDPDQDVDKLVESVAELSFEQQVSATQENIHHQMSGLTSHLRQVLTGSAEDRTSSQLSTSKDHSGTTTKKSTTKKPKRRSYGLAFATGAPTKASSQTLPTSVLPSRSHRTAPRPLDLATAAGALEERLGYSLHVRDSGIGTEEAGKGLYVEGTIPVGSLVCLYPGVVYRPRQYRLMANYPRVDLDNPYLLARFDGAVIDSKPWGTTGAGLGGHVAGGPAFPWRPQVEATLEDSMIANLYQATGIWERILRRFKGRLSEDDRARLKALEEEALLVDPVNPFALGHYANHPPKGGAPNLISAAYNFPLEHEAMRWFLPNIVCGDAEESDAQAVLPVIVLIAARELKDEELFLNYRLSPGTYRPDWYHVVDGEEESRRWA
ncbi:hypothetical protein CYMTET_54710 [Cymbomonas tetramitiformis]|uniref:SET domain-containing protein n=1 Tax=Cymbomonas tetramitiformis TaxID=36881 RepID=A0AAE0BFL1_9CHLO|nr:hypothetical protein CYMTET_54710 [Cymbomonas tetramitiformis]